MESQINPFDSQETKPYKNDPEIVPMTVLVNAYQRKDIDEVHKVLNGTQTSQLNKFRKQKHHERSIHQILHRRFTSKHQKPSHFENG
jgi:hypothetical protein